MQQLVLLFCGSKFAIVKKPYPHACVLRGVIPTGQYSTLSAMLLSYTGRSSSHQYVWGMSRHVDTVTAACGSCAATRDDRRRGAVQRVL